MKKFAKITAVALVVIMALAVLTACGYPSDPEKAKAKLEKQGYTVTLVKNTTSLGKLEAKITAIKNEDGKLTTIIVDYYKDTDSAKSAYENDKKLLDQAKDSNKENGITATVSRSGKQVISKTVTNTSK